MHNDTEKDPYFQEIPGAAAEGAAAAEATAATKENMEERDTGNPAGQKASTGCRKKIVLCVIAALAIAAILIVLFATGRKNRCCEAE